MSIITIEGVIGVGKTSLARYLQHRLQASLMLEVFEENPFLGDFYQDRGRYAFQTQLFFLVSRYQQLRELSKLPRPVVTDYMFPKDRLFAELTLRGEEWRMYERVYEALLENTTPPDLVVYLRADTPTLMQRIRQRGRSYEQNMDEAYIDSLRLAYEDFFHDYDPRRLLLIESHSIDFVQNEADRRDLLQRILERLGEPALP